MASTDSWAWYSTTPWPGFDPQNQSNLNSNGNGTPVDPNGISTVTWNDNNNDGVINDSDTDDGLGAQGDTVTVGGQTRTVNEVANYTNSTLVHDGTTYTVSMAVWLFEDGTYIVRIPDSQIPPGSYVDVTQMNLGRWDGVEYSGSYVATRDEGFVCFAAGTLIDTRDGPQPAETLQPDAAIRTLDHGLQPLRWIGRARVAAQGAMAPITFAPGAIGNTRALRVSPQHRVLLTGWRAELLTGLPEVLATARHLVNDRTIRRTPCAAVTYVHLLFDRHELVFSEGVPSESFHPTARSLTLLDRATRDEVLALFPALARPPSAYGASDCGPSHYGPAARPQATRAEARLLGAGRAG